MSGRNGSYIGAPEVQSLIGAWQDIVGGGPWQDILGAEVSYPYGVPQQRHRPHHPHHHHQTPWYQGRNTAPYRPAPAPYVAPRPYTPPYAAPYRPYAPAAVPATVRDHRRVAFIRGAVAGDPVSLGALSLMGAEDLAAAQQGTVPADATIPAPPLAPGDAAAAASAAANPPPPPPPGPAAAAAVNAVQATDPTAPPFDGGGGANPNTRPHHHHHGGWGGIPPRNMLVDRPSPSRADRVILPMSSGVNILPSTSAQITARPQNVAFRPERIVIGGTPGDWIVNDIKVGNQSQLSQSGDLPGEMFSATMVDGFISFGTVQTAMDFVIQVTFIGDSEGGAPFFCGVLGTAAV